MCCFSMASDGEPRDTCVAAIHSSDEAGLRAQLGLLNSAALLALLLSTVDEPLAAALAGRANDTAPSICRNRGGASRGNSLLHLCAESDDFVACARALLESAASIAAAVAAPPHATLVHDMLLRTNARGLSPLHVAVQAGALACARLLLCAATESTVAGLLDARNEWGESPLHLAAAAGRAPVVACLVDASARAGIDRTRATDKWGRTAACVAREQGVSEVARLLGDPETAAAPLAPRERAAAPRAQRSALQLELMAAIAQRRSRPQLGQEHAPQAEPRMAATVRFESPPQLAVLGMQPSAQPAPPGGVRAPPLRAALSKLIEFQVELPEFARLLADARIDRAGRDAFGLSALHKAAAWDRPELIAALLDGGGLNEAECNAAAGAQRWTPLHHAAAEGALRTYALLCECALVDRTLVDAAGRTAADLLMPPG